MKINFRHVVLLIIIIFMFLLIYNFVYASEQNYLKDALDSVDTEELDNYLKDNSKYFMDNNYSIKSLVQKAISGNLNVNIFDYIKYQFKSQTDFIKSVIVTSVKILLVCIILTIIKYFSEEINNNSVSEVVVFFSIIIVFIIVVKDLNYVKELLKTEYIKFDEITQNINGLFLASMISLGKIGLLQFFQSYSNYIIGITTRIIYNFTEIMTVILIVIVLINNISTMINAKLLYKFLKKATLIILSAYIFIVVINFSVQGYILYKTDNIFINSVKALSPSSVPMVGNTFGNFFGLFMSSILLIKDIMGFVIILFIFSIFGSSLIRLFVIFILYRATAAVCEPFNSNISILMQEMSDIMYIYLACLLTPVIIITAYYSITLSFLNNIFG